MYLQSECLNSYSTFWTSTSQANSYREIQITDTRTKFYPDYLKCSYFGLLLPSAEFMLSANAYSYMPPSINMFAVLFSFSPHPFFWLIFSSPTFIHPSFLSLVSIFKSLALLFRPQSASRAQLARSQSWAMSTSGGTCCPPTWRPPASTWATTSVTAWTVRGGRRCGRQRLEGAVDSHMPPCEGWAVQQGWWMVDDILQAWREHM